MSREGATARGRVGGPDVAIALLVLAATIFHLTRFPLHVPPWSDEARQLYEARRVLEGERMYRDVFDFIMPGWIYLMALVYRLFGATLFAARTTVAVLHGVTAALIFVACRQLGVRRGLAVAAAGAYLVLCPPAFPVASQHWLATSLSVLLLVVCLGPFRSAARPFAAGCIVGAMIGVLQQRGALWAAGCGAFLLADAGLAARDGAPFLSTLRRRLLLFAAGTAAIVVPLFVWLVASAGLERVWTAVVVYPLINYRSTFRLPWGSGGGNTRTLPSVIAALPYAAALPVVRLLAQPLLRAGTERVRALVLIATFSGCALLSIAYLPDFIHLSFAVPFLLVAAAQSFDRALRLLPPRAGASLGWAVSAALVGASAVRLEGNLAVARAVPLVRWQSAFGTVDVSRQTVEFFTRLDALLDEDPSRALYVHPDARYIYLLAGARNPTRFQFIFLGFHVDAEVRETIDVLSARPPPFVITMPNFVRPEDPIARFIEERYESTAARRKTGLVLWKLRRDPPASPLT